MVLGTVLGMEEERTIEITSESARAFPRTRARRRDAAPEPGSAVPSAEEAPRVELTPEQVAQIAFALQVFVAGLYEVVGRLETSITAYATHLPREQVAPIMQYSQAEVEKLAPVTSAVLAKHWPSLGKWQEELTLVTTLVSVHQDKFERLEKLKAELLRPRRVPEEKVA